MISLVKLTTSKHRSILSLWIGHLHEYRGSSFRGRWGQRRHHAHAAEDDEPSKKRSRHESEDSSSEDEYVLISTLTGNIIHGSDYWLIDSGASKHMMGFKESFVRLSEHEWLGDDYQCPIKGSGESSYKLYSGKSLTMKEVLFVLGLKKNLLSISALMQKEYGLHS